MHRVVYVVPRNPVECVFVGMPRAVKGPLSERWLLNSLLINKMVGRDSESLDDIDASDFVVLVNIAGLLDTHKLRHVRDRRRVAGLGPECFCN